MKQFYFYILFLSFSFYISAQTKPTGNSTEVGITEGQLTISLNGTANYAVPIAVPPGINGVTPQISLSYNSQNGLHGNAALGWNITGISSITRIPATKFHDEVIDPVDFDALDRFAFEGQRLIVKSGGGTYGANETVYETELFSNIKITSYGVHPNGSSYGPAYFIVEYPDGSKAYYGNTANSRSVTEWSITNWINPQNVQVSYEYITSKNTLYISSLKYGTTATTAPINEIQFSYETRTNVDNSYIEGINIIRDKNLSEIKVLGNGIGYRSYKLGYNPVDKIGQIDEKSGDSTKSYNPTVFRYDAAMASGIAHIEATSNLNLPDITTKNTASISGDFDADGKMDLILYRTSGTDMKNKYWLYTNINSNNTNIAYQHNIGPFQDIFPVTSLGSSNIVLPQGWAVTKKTDTNYTFTIFSNGSTSAVAEQYNKVVNFPLDLIDETCNPSCVITSETGRIFPKKIISGDFNGDGLTDVMAFDITATVRYCTENLSTGKCSATNEDAVSKKVYFVDLKRDNTSNFLFFAGELPGLIYPTTRIEVADFNGDGKSDFFIFDPGYVKIYTLSETNTLVLLYQNTVADNAIVSSMPILMGDYNGDDKFEFMIPKGFESSDWYKYTSTGISLIKEEKSYSATFSSNNANNTYSFFSTDINNDNKTDLVCLSSNRNTSNTLGTAVLAVFPNLRGDFTSSGAGHSIQNSSIYIDMLPIYLPQSMQSVSNGVNVVASTLEVAFINQSKINFFVSEQNLTQNNLLTKITTGNGVEEIIEYNTLDLKNTDADGNRIYTPSTTVTNYPNLDIKINPNLFLVSKIEKHSSSVYKKRMFYYYGATSNLQGLGFLGFRSLSQTDWHDDTSTIFSNVFNNNIALRGALIEKFKVPYKYYPDGYSAPSDFFTKSVITYDNSIDPLQSNKVFKLKIINTKEFNSLNNTNSETNNILYDSFNNITASKTYAREGSTLIKTITSTIDYQPAVTTPFYVLGRPSGTTQTVTADGHTMSSKEIYTYNSQQLLVNTDKSATGTVTVTESNDYDAYGNIIKKTITAPLPMLPRITKFEYDSTKRFVSKITDNDDLVTTFEYDGNGLLKKETDPYLLSKSYTYDAWFKNITVKDDQSNQVVTKTYTRSNEKTVLNTTISAPGLDTSVTEDTFDDLGRKIKSGVKDLNGNISYVSYQYDIYDRNTKTSEPYFGASASQWNEVKFDAYGRSSQGILFNGKISSVSYPPASLKATLTDGARSKTTTTNAVGNTISTDETIGGQILYNYFANGSLRKTSYNGVDIVMEQDGWGNKTKMTDPTAGTYRYGYNDLGELATETIDGTGITTTITRDKSGKPIKKTITGSGTNSETTYTYDGYLPLVTVYKDLNEPTGSNTTTTTLTYDASKRIASIVEDKTGVSKFTRIFTYDNLDRIVTETKTAEIGSIKSSIKTKNVYKNGNLHQILLDDGTNKVLWQTTTLNAKGQILESETGNGIKTTTAYDTDGYLATIKYDKTTAPTANILTLTTSFDKNTNYLKNRINNAFGNYAETFFYDDIGRLKEFTNKTGVQETQTYDVSGKITGNSLGTYGYDPAKPFQNTSITLNPEATGYYANREGIFNDAMESKTGWGTEKSPNTNFFSYDGTKAGHAVGKNTLKLANTTTTEQYVFSDKWIDISNAAPTQYTYSAWFYSDNPQAELFLYMKDGANTITQVNMVNNTKGAWTQIMATFLVPANIKKLRLRLDNNGLGNIWYDDVEIRKTSDPASTVRSLIVTYNAFKSASLIEESNVDKISFTYNDDNQRSTMYYGGFADKLLRQLRKHYSADGSMEIKQNILTNTFDFVTYIGGDGYTAPIAVKSDGTTQNYLYLHRDYQGTILAVTNATGALVEKRLFDAWGNIIKVQDGAGAVLNGLTVLDRGYTGHEHLQSVGLINMNARLYDPMLHRFLQTDNYIQDPTNTQNYNPYGYVLNNPLLYTDPSGDLSQKTLKSIFDNSPGVGTGTMWYGDGSGNFDSSVGFVNSNGDFYASDSRAEHLPNVTIYAGKANNASIIQNHVYDYSEYYGNSMQKSSLFDGNVSLFDAGNVGIGIYGYALAKGQKIMIAEATFLKNKNTLTSLAKLAKLNQSIASADKIAKGLGIAGAALTITKVVTDYVGGKDLTAGQLFDVGLSVTLAIVTVSNPFALVGFAAYGILDATGALDSIKSSLGGDTVILKSNF